MTEDKDLVSVEQWRGMNRGREDMRLTSADTNSAPSVLKPCPLCEGEAIKQVVENELGDHCCAISCGHCGLRGPLKLLEKSYAEAITAWNRRASDPVRAELLEALKKISRTPSRPFPDPSAHSMQAYAAAVRTAWGDIQNIARAAITRAEME